MFAIFIAAINTALGFIFRTALIKFVMFSAIYIMVVEVLPLIVTHLPGGEFFLAFLRVAFFFFVVS
ncbi:hypothetical protein [Escherichia coli]